MAKTAEPKPSSDPDLSEAQAEQKVERPVNNLESKGDQKDEENDVEPSALKVSTSPSDEVYKIEPKPTDNTLSIASCEPDNQDKPESRAGQQLTVPLTIDLKARTQSAPTMNTSSMGIPASDSASIASIPLGLDISGVSNADQKGNGEPSAPCQQPPDVSSLTPPQLESKPLPPVVLSRTQSQPEQLQSVSLPILEQANPEPVQPIRPQHIKEEGQQVVQQPQLQANPEPMQPIPPQNIEGGQAMQQPQLQANQEPAQPITPQHIEEGGQVVQQPQLLVGGQVVQQPQLLVAVPLQQPSNEGMQQNLEQSTTTSTGAQVYAQQTQQRVYCQFPGVVTLPVTQTTEGQASMPCTTSQPNAMLQQEVPTGLHQPNLAQLQIQRVHSQEQVIGMVGAIPIVKIQAPQQQPVKRKKGRFKLLQETPSVAIGIANNTTSAGVAASTAAVASSPNTAQQPPTNAPIPINISVPASQGQSMTSAVSQLSLNIPNPQTFDGTSAPRVKKMGRFVVSNVKDPTSIPMAIQPQQGQSPAAMPTEQSVQQQVQQNQQISMNQNQTLQPTQYTHVQNQPPNQQMAGQHARSLSVPTNFVDTQPFPMVLTIAEPQTLTSYSALGVVQQQQIPQASPARGQQLPPLPPQQLPSDNLSQTQVSASKSTPPSTPGGSMPNNFVESPMRSKLVTNMQNVPLPKIPQSAEKQKAVNGGVPKKKAAQNRGGKLPQTIGSNGVLSSVGLGKVFYFLEQMKVEVTEADRIIKTLQTDMKLLRDKNKELEAKNTGLEKKLKEEKSLREKAEARTMEIRRKMRDTIGDTSVQKQVDSALDDNPGMRSRVYSADHVGPSGTAGTTKESQTPRKKLAVTAPTKPAAKSEDTPSANGATSPKPSKPAASPKQTITKGIAPRSDANHKEDTTTKISSPRHTRSKSLAHGSEGLSLNRAPLYTSLAASPAKINPLITQPRLNDTTVPSKTRPPPARPTKTGQTGQPAPAPKLQVSDFDPLKRTSSAPPDVPGNVMPVISIPTQVSLEAVPLNSSSPLFQSTAEPTYSASSAPLSAQFSQGTIVGYLPHNPNVANGIHELQQQSFMFLPQQQPFMLQQVTGGVNEFSNVVTGQWAQTIPSSYPPVYMNGLQQQVPQQQQQHVSQQPLQQQQNGSLNSYDAFTSDPFDEQHVSQQLPQQQQNRSLNPYDAFTSDPFDDLLTRRTMD